MTNNKVEAANDSSGETIIHGVKAKLTFDEQVVKKIAGIAVSEIPGVLGLNGNAITNLTDKFINGKNMTKGINAEVGTKQVAIDLDVISEYGENIVHVFDEAIKKVAEKIKTMTGLDVVEFNMNVTDIMTREQYEEKFGGRKEKEKEKEEEKQEVAARSLQ